VILFEEQLFSVLHHGIVAEKDVFV